jgi:uncharacterized membrane protein YkvA (DUF1232 family)
MPLEPSGGRAISSAMSILTRLVRFRNELGILWRAFLSPLTPLWLKGLMLLVPAYFFLPLDIIPDFIPIAGWIDDAIVIPLLVSWIVTLIERTSRPTPSANRYESSPQDGPVIDGRARRL